MSIAAQTQSDFLADIEVPAGCDGFYGFSIAPLDLSGTTANLYVYDATGNLLVTYAVTITVDLEGDVPVSTLSTPLPRSLLPVTGVYTWKLQVTWPFSPTFILQYGHGSFYVRG